MTRKQRIALHLYFWKERQEEEGILGCEIEWESASQATTKHYKPSVQIYRYIERQE